MNASVAWSAGARRGYLASLAYLIDRSPRSAAALRETVKLQLARLSRFPESGRKVPEMPDALPAVRELIIMDHRLIYSYEHRSVRIQAFLHARREFKPSLLH